MPIQKLLELSTTHLSTADQEILADLAGYGGGHPPSSHPIVVHVHATGWTVKALPLNSERTIQAESLGLSAAFIDILERSESEKAALIRFDKATEIDPSLPVFHQSIQDARVVAQTDAPSSGFRRTRVTIDILSEDPIAPIGLSDLARGIYDGDYVGGPVTKVETVITSKTAAKMLREFGSEPGFFQLDDDGHPVNAHKPMA